MTPGSLDRAPGTASRERATPTHGERERTTASSSRATDDAHVAPLPRITRITSGARALGRVSALVLAGLVVSAAVVGLGSACTPVPIVGYDAAPVEGGVDGGDAQADAAFDGEAGPPHPKKEYDAGIDDDAFPSAADGELELRMRHLLDAIVAGDPALAPDLLYPRDAWVRSHDAIDPGKAWDHKVKPAFLRDIAKLHRGTKAIDHAKFVSFELGHAITHAPVKAHDLKRPVWRVRHSKLTFKVDEKLKRMDISEMTSFRGAWYVTKLR